MSKPQTEKFFDQLEKDKTLRVKIKLGLETLAKIAADYNVTQEELSAELEKRWQHKKKIIYSEPPGF